MSSILYPLHTDCYQRRAIVGSLASRSTCIYAQFADGLLPSLSNGSPCARSNVRYHARYKRRISRCVFRLSEIDFAYRGRSCARPRCTCALCMCVLSNSFRHFVPERLAFVENRFSNNSIWTELHRACARIFRRANCCTSHRQACINAIRGSLDDTRKCITKKKRKKEGSSNVIDRWVCSEVCLKSPINLALGRTDKVVKSSPPG